MVRRFGFWPEYTAAIVVAVILGASLAAGIAAGLDTTLGHTLERVLGPPDDYTLIVHVRERQAEAAAHEIGPLLASLDGDGSSALALRAGVTVAGNANFFITIPETLLSSDFLERMPVVLQQLSGFNGHTWLLEPSVTVAGVQSGPLDVIAAEAEALDGVRAVVRHGGRVTVVLVDESFRGPVGAYLEQWLAERRLAEIRWDEAADFGVTSRVRTSLEQALGTGSWRILGEGDELQTDSTVDEAIAALSRLPAVWEQLTAAGAVTEDALRQLLEMLDTLEPALALTEQPERQAERIAKSLRDGDRTEAVKDVLVNVAVSMLWQSLTAQSGSMAKAAGGAATDAPSPGMGSDPGQRALLDQWQEVRATVARAVDSAARLSELSGPDLDTVSRAMAAVERWAPAPDEPGASKLALLVGASVVPSVLKDAVQRELTDGAVDGTGKSAAVTVSLSAPGVVEPNPRAVLADLLADVRGAVAGLLALFAAGAILVFDHAIVFAAGPGIPFLGRRTHFVAAAVGAVLFSATYALAGGAVPGFGIGAGSSVGIIVIAALGAATGLLTNRFAGRISPLDESALLAGRSLGLSDTQLLRELVVPQGRPGVLTFLNRFQRRF